MPDTYENRTEPKQRGAPSNLLEKGRDACVFANTGEGKKLRLRGIYARVVEDGRIAVGDRAVKVGSGE
jgi:MOSC domain-containing protein YiiM